MTTPTLEILALVYWELCLLLASVRLAYIFGCKYDVRNVHQAELLLAWLGINIILSAGIASVLSFAKFNGAGQYLVAATLLLVVLYFRSFSQLKSDIRRLASMFDETVMGRPGWLWIVSLTLLLPALLKAMRPIDEMDSLYHLNFMLDWLSNKTTPYVFAHHFVLFWELTYIPSMAITRSDLFLWLTSLKPVLVVGLGIYSIGRKLGFSRHLMLIGTLNSIALYHFWSFFGWPSGVGTLKNDMIFAAGVVLIAFAALQILRLGVARSGGLLLTLGLTFVTVKYTGLLIIVLSLLLIAILNVNQLWKARRAVFMWTLLSFVFLLVTTGHYYLRNLLEYGNPFYPIQIHIMNIRLPGIIDLSGTSILESLSDVRVYQAFFFPESGMSPAGLLFPLTLASILVASSILSVRSVINLFRRKPLLRIEEGFLAGYILLTWLVYFRSFWSASANPGDLVYLYNLNSLRYVKGTLALSELFLVYLLTRSKFPKILILGLVGLSLLSRLVILYHRWPSEVGNPALMLLLIGIISGPILIGFLIIRSSRFRIIVSCCVLGLLVAIVGPLAVEINRAAWAPWWRDVVWPLHNLPPAKVYVVREPGWANSEPGWRYLVSGKRFQHDAQIGTEQDLLNLLDKEEAYPDYVVQLRNRNFPDRPKLAAFGSRLFSHEYATIAINDFSILLQVAKRVPLADVISERPPKVWFIGTDTSLLPGAAVDMGNAKPELRELRSDDLVLFGTPPQLYRIGDRKLNIVVADEGTKVLAINLGLLDEKGKAQGLEFTYTGECWVPNMSGIQPINPDYDFAIARATNSIGPWEISVSKDGTYQVEHLTDETGSFIRIMATSDAQWLVIVGRLPRDLPDYIPITVRGQIRSFGLAEHSLDLFDLSDKGKFDHLQRKGSSRGNWELLNLSARVRFWSPQDYYALGLIMPRKGDYFDVRELSLYQGFLP
jgi:hypothetical protein